MTPPHQHGRTDGLARPFVVAAVLAVAVTLGACANDRATSGPPVSSASTMAGRWMLSSPGAGSCAMTFGGGPGEGTIAPEGGCPGNFFTSRKWTFDGSSLVIKNHLGDTLAQLKSGDGGRYDGQSTAGQPVTLSR
jgi:Protease inhibitor Inh